MMISRRNYVMLTAIMLVILFMFQAAGVAKNRLNDAQTNEYADENRTELRAADAFTTDQKLQKLRASSDDAEQESSNSRLIVFVGDGQKSRVIDTVRQWCTYSKRALIACATAAQALEYQEQTELLLVDTQTIDIAQETPLLNEAAAAGSAIVLCNLPDVSVVAANAELEKLCGIMTVYEQAADIRGVMLFDGFLLGGEQVYMQEKPEELYRQDMELTVPWYLTLSANKSYMVGLLDDLKLLDGELDNEYAPNLIWRTSGAGAPVFVVNGDFMEDATGIGILEAMAYELHEYEIYPVVNAQNLSVVNYPSFADENSEEMMERYSRELPSLYRDVIWQSISSVAERSRSRITALLSPQYDYTDGNEPSSDAFTYYARLLREKHMELGLSLDQISDVPLEEKVASDLSFLNENLAGYEYRSIYMPVTDADSYALLHDADGLSGITTVLSDYDEAEPLLSYEGDCCVQRSTNDAFRHTNTDDLRMRAVESALGYTSVILNMKRAAYPQSEDDSWERLYEHFSSNQLTYWEGYEAFDKTTLSESDVRVRRFLNLDFSEERKGQTLTVSIGQFEENAYFILRTHGERITEAEGASYTEIEEHAWLIHAQAEQFSLTLEKDGAVEYDGAGAADVKE